MAESSHFSEWLSKTRTASGVSKVQLAKKSGIDEQRIAAYERGDKRAKTNTIKKLETGLGQRFLPDTGEFLREFKPHEESTWPKPGTPGIYVLSSSDLRPVFVGVSECIRTAIQTRQKERWYVFPIVATARYAEEKDQALRERYGSILLSVIGESNLILNGVPEQVGSNIRAAREAKGWIQKTLADRVGVSPGLVSHWETSRVEPSYEQLLNLEKEFGSRLRERTLEEWLKEARKRRGFEEKDLATKSGVSSQQIKNIESGRSKNSWSVTVQKLEEALGETFGEDANALPPGKATTSIGQRKDFDPHYRGDKKSQSERTDPSAKRPWPQKNNPGVYVFFSSDGHPEYVGKAGDVRTRLSQHEEKFWFRKPVLEKACYFPIEDREMRARIEGMLISVIGEKQLILNKRTEST